MLDDFIFLTHSQAAESKLGSSLALAMTRPMTQEPCLVAALFKSEKREPLPTLGSWSSGNSLSLRFLSLRVVSTNGLVLPFNVLLLDTFSLDRVIIIAVTARFLAFLWGGYLLAAGPVPSFFGGRTRFFNFIRLYRRACNISSVLRGRSGRSEGKTVLLLQSRETVADGLWVTVIESGSDSIKVNLDTGRQR